MSDTLIIDTPFNERKVDNVLGENSANVSILQSVNSVFVSVVKLRVLLFKIWGYFSQFCAHMTRVSAKSEIIPGKVS